MPIAVGQPTFAFTEASIKNNAPSASGVYALCNQDGVYLYFGETNDLQRRLLEHLNETGTCIKRQGAANFAFDFVSAQTRVKRQNELILAYRTPCNQMLG